MVTPSGSDALRRARDAWGERDLWKAKALIEEALGSISVGDELARARFLAGVIYREIGDSHAAHEQFTALLGDWGGYPGSRPLLEGPALYNLALVHYQRKEFSASVEANRRAVELFRTEGLRDYLRKGLQNLAWSLCCMGEYEAAEQTLDTVSAEHLIPHDDPEALWQQRLGYLFCTFLSGAYVETIQSAAEILRGADVPGDVLSHTLWIAGRAQLALGDTGSALVLANQAVAWGIEAKDSRCMNDGNALRREILTHAERAFEEQGA